LRQALATGQRLKRHVDHPVQRSCVISFDCRHESDYSYSHYSNVPHIALEPLVWPIFIYAATSPDVGLLAEIALWDFANPNQPMRLLFPDRLPGTILLVVLIAVICLRYATRQGNRSLFAREVILLSALVILSAGAPGGLNISFPNAGPFVVLIVILKLVISVTPHSIYAHCSTHPLLTSRSEKSHLLILN
jgi:hypothetical protein